MHARIGTWEGSAEDLDRWVARSRDEVRPAVESQPGLHGALWLLDRENARGLTITLWESEEAMRESDAFAARTQGGTANVSGARVTTTRDEVVARIERPGSPA